MVDFFMRITSTSSTIIDLVVTNNLLVKTRTISNRISDHEINTKVRQTESEKYKTVVSWKHYSKDVLIELLLRLEWSYFYSTDD